MPIDPRQPLETSPEGRMWNAIRDLQRQMRHVSSWFNGGSISQLPVVEGLPLPGRLGRCVVLKTDGRLYVDDGSTWVAQGP